MRHVIALAIVAGLACGVGCTTVPDPSPSPTVRGQEPIRAANAPTFPAPPEHLEAGTGPLPDATPPHAASDTPLPINLATALRLAGARPLDVQIAGRHVEAAAAVYDRAKLLWVPNFVVGLDYFAHAGLQQNFAGEVLNSTRDTFMLGVGPNVVFAFSDAVYAPLASRQELRARQLSQQATINDVSLTVAEAYFDVQQARGELVGALLAVAKAEDLANRASGLAKGLAPPQEEARAKVELARRRQAAISARERWRTASAELARLLRLDPSAVIEPIEPAFLPVTVIDPSVPVDGLIPIALTSRPELAGNQALVQATLARLKQEKIRPLIPSLAVRSVSTNPSGTLGYGLFGGGGRNQPADTFGTRFDIDMQLVWELQAFGLGNRARVNERRAEHAAAILEHLRTQDLVAAEVVRAFAQVRAAAERLNEAEPALRDAIDLVNKSIEGLGQTRRVADGLILVVRPQEAVAAVQAFALANNDFYGAVADYNRAQFRLYRALGHPAQCLAAAVPGADINTNPPIALPAAQPDITGSVPNVKEESPRSLPVIPKSPQSIVLPAPTRGIQSAQLNPKELPVIDRRRVVPVPPAVFPDEAERPRPER